eukprot:9267541-Pyramimonas_sp.AAC.1
MSGSGGKPWPHGECGRRSYVQLWYFQLHMGYPAPGHPGTRAPGRAAEIGAHSPPNHMNPLSPLQ